MQLHFPGKKVVLRQVVEPIPEPFKRKVSESTDGMPKFFGVIVTGEMDDG